MKKGLILALIVILTTGFAYAEEKEGFWYSLLKKLNTISTRGTNGRTYTSVVGIRGAEDTSSDELYWKGEEAKNTETQTGVSDEELSDFRLAVDQATQGESEQAMASFQAFLDKYPDSRLTADANAAISQLKTEVSSAE